MSVGIMAISSDNQAIDLIDFESHFLDLKDDNFEQIIVDKIIELQVPHIRPKRRFFARRQIIVYINKIKIHPEKLSFYIDLIKDLIEYEKKV